MSAPLAGKFQDHYLILGVNPNADPDTIQEAYTRSAQKYHPSTPITGSTEKFEAVNLAFEVLSDPQLRAEFNKVKGLDQDQGPAKFDAQDFFRFLGLGSKIRAALLCILYDRRRSKPFRPSLSMRDIEAMLDASTEELSFVIWYMKQRSWITSDDKSALQITADGMDFLDANPPMPDAVMSCIKAAARVGRGVTAPPASPPALAPGPVVPATTALAEPEDQIIWQQTSTPQPAPAQEAEPLKAEPEFRAQTSLLAALSRALAAADQRSAAAAELLEQEEKLR